MKSIVTTSIKLKPDDSTLFESQKIEVDPTSQPVPTDIDSSTATYQALSTETLSNDDQWALDGSCMEKPHKSVVSNVTNHSCGFCGESSSSNYLRQLRDEIASKFQEQCQEMVVYGAAYGEDYDKWLRSTKGLHFNPKPYEGVCFFQFVRHTINKEKLQGNDDQWLSADGSQNLILVDTEKMPYINNRRNVKVLKMNPGLLFPWAKRITWQDTKLVKKFSNKLPHDYLLHFNRTVQRTGTCTSFIGLPHHRFAIWHLEPMSLRNHCKMIQEASKDRPTVSDDIDVLTNQCDRYIKTYDPTNDLFTQAQMVDSAFIVYDMQNDACQEFNGKLGCSWLDEIHSNSDRDQISFPHVVRSLGLKLPSNIVDDPGLRNKVYTDEQGRTMMHVAKRSCHWYYDNISRCIGEDEDITTTDIDELLTNPIHKEDNSTATDEKISRVAVIVAGTLKRFMFQSGLTHFHKPMIDSKILADYYLSLTTADAKAYRSNSGYTDHFQQDPNLPNSTLPDSFADVEEYIRLKLGDNYKEIESSVGALIIQDDIDIDSEPMLKARRERAMEEHPNEDPDTRFPIFDMRNADISRRTADANRNLLKLHLAVRNLWIRVMKWEAEMDFQYDYVIILRDDSMWLNDFNLTAVVKGCSGDVFVPSCNARSPPMLEQEICDHILISRRHTADIFGNYYSKLLESDTNECMDQLTDELRQSGNRGCNSEMLLKWMIEKNDGKIAEVGQGLMPFQRSANVRLPDGKNLQCFHKFCQSEEDPLDMSSIDIDQCKTIDWGQYSWK